MKPNATSKLAAVLACLVATGGAARAALPTPWQSADIGSPAIAGGADEEGGVFTVTGAGADIWGSSDQCHFLYQSTQHTGDFGFTAHILTQDNTSSWAKAGVMIRESLDAGSIHAMCAITPSNGATLQYRGTTDGSSSNGGTVSGRTVPEWVRLERIGTTVTAFISEDGEGWHEFTSATITMADSVYIGIAVTSHDAAAACTVTVEDMTIPHAIPEGSVPSPWAAADVGDCKLIGYSDEAAGVFTVKASGADIWGAADAFRYVYQPVTGNWEALIEVTSLEDTDPWAKAGLMLRESLDAGSRHATVLTSVDYGGRLQYRETTDGTSAGSSSSSYGFIPCHLRLVRFGDEITAHASQDGVDWGLMGTCTIAIPDGAYLGMAVTAHQTWDYCTATYEGFTLNPITATGDGLAATYFDQPDLTGSSVSRVEPVVDLDWGEGTPDATIPVDGFSARFTGTATPYRTGWHTFFAQADDGVRLWVDGELLVDEWHEDDAETEYSGGLELEAGTAYFIKLEYYEDEGNAEVRLSWQPPDRPKEVVPQYVLDSGAGDTEAPLAPTSLTATAVAPNNIELSWPASGSADVVAYEILRGGVVVGMSGRETSYVDEMLCFETEYTYEVRAVDAAYNVSTTNPTASATTGSAPFEGSGDGLFGTYYDDVEFTGSLATRTDATVDFDWGTGAPHPSIGPETFSVVWTGQVMPLISTDWTFHTISDDGVRLYVGGQLVVDSWKDQAATEHTGTIPLVGGLKYPVRMEYYDNTNHAVAKLQWSCVCVPQEAIPTTQLYSSDPELEVTSPKPDSGGVAESAVSPVWLEGSCDPDATTVTVTADAGATTFDITRENAFRWYADDGTDSGALGIPITNTGTWQRVVNVTSDGAGTVGDVTLTWTLTDMAAADAITIRVGSKLRLTSGTTGTNLLVDADGNPADYELSGTVADGVVAEFTEAGTIQARAKVDDVEAGTLEIIVVGVADVPPVGAWIDHLRDKDLTVTPVSAVDSLTACVADRSKATVYQQLNWMQTLRTTLLGIEGGTSSLQVRLGDGAGPVVRDVELHSFELSPTATVLTPALMTYDGGDRLVAQCLTMTPRFDGHRIAMTIFAGGSVFYDNGGTEQTVETDSLDQNGQVNYLMVVPPGGVICHRMALADEE